jgi:hypothetical protein
MYIKRFFNITICLIVLAQTTYSQGFSDLIGKPLDFLETFELIQSSKDPFTENFLPHLNQFEMLDSNNGLKLKFNAALILNQVELFDKGTLFKRFKGDLPLNLQWGMDSITIIRTCGMIFSENPINPYIITTQQNEVFIQLFFSDKKLSMIRMTGTDQKIENGILSDLLQVRYRLFPDGDVVAGNTLDGKGQMSWDNDFISYDGEWSYGLPHGAGFYRDSLFVRYEGNFKLGFIWGKGLMLSPKGEIRLYDGEFVMGLRTGIGKGRFEDGRWYEGKWYRNQPHGYGMLKYQNGIKYTGMFDNGQAHGKGKMERPDGYIDGEFHRGKPNGYCKQFISNTGQILAGNFVMGRKEGEFEYIQGDQKQIIVFKNDQLVVPSQ